MRQPPSFLLFPQNEKAPISFNVCSWFYICCHLCHTCTWDVIGNAVADRFVSILSADTCDTVLVIISIGCDISVPIICRLIDNRIFSFNYVSLFYCTSFFRLRKIHETLNFYPTYFIKSILFSLHKKQLIYSNKIEKT